MRVQRQSTPFAILALLTLKPMSGYELKKLMQGSIAHFWTESYGQIYPALRKLASECLAQRKTERSSGKPERQVYRITTKGRTVLRRWLESEPRVQPPRSELLLKL
ncbi:MAG: PadR family transcriptional regulator, partial [Acidobacteriales bacterium]|nr:PadR family transcriptional regulator [Terriglobales bacterium]